MISAWWQARNPADSVGFQHPDAEQRQHPQQIIIIQYKGVEGGLTCDETVETLDRVNEL